MKFKERLRELRKEKKITQVELGKKLNYGYTAIANYESGRNRPKFEDLIVIADVLDTSIEYLLGISDVRCDTEMKQYMTIEKNILKIAEQNGIELNMKDRLIICFMYQMLKENYSDKIHNNTEHCDKENIEKLMQEIKKESCTEFSERFYYFIRNEIIRDAVLSQI